MAGIVVVLNVLNFLIIPLLVIVIFFLVRTAPIVVPMAIVRCFELETLVEKQQDLVIIVMFIIIIRQVLRDGDCEVVRELL